ncbi:hypothetical protein EDB84DRAFT_1447007 [Lactarius hengduanensis]|nr:hypothetical protein EDB84DRAFT_1447007 [Lactarius hengduanensis]
MNMAVTNSSTALSWPNLSFELTFCSVCSTRTFHGSNKTVREACTPNGGLKEAHEIIWHNDPDDVTLISNRKSALSERPSGSPTQTTLTVFGITATGQHPADDEPVGSATGSDGRRIPCIQKPTAKAKEALVNGGVKTTAKKRSAVILTSETEDDVQPPRKRKNKTGKKDAEDVSLIEEPRKTSKGCVFSRASEESQDSCVNMSRSRIVSSITIDRSLFHFYFCYSQKDLKFCFWISVSDLLLFLEYLPAHASSYTCTSILYLAQHLRVSGK